ncbi:MAG: hypothetical protein IKU45_05910 [Clostridia bacterium]|nr:hypothetical protein [Clostridia bacterium]
MKKFLSLLLVLLMVVSLVACGSEKEPAKTPEKTDTPEKFTPETIPAEKVNPRDVVVDYMYEMANIKWTPAEDIDSTQVHSSLYYKKGETYYGIMYVTGSRTLTDADEFREQLDENGVYTGPANAQSGFGNHCSSAIRLAYDQVSTSVKFGYTGEMIPMKNKGMLPLGNYKHENAYQTSYGIFDANPDKNVFIEGYALLQKGDAILTCWPKANDPNSAETGHARMILSVDIVKTAAGKINPHKSTVTTIEQTSSFDKQAKDGINTTWYVEHVYTFNDLLEDKYIPLTIEAFNETPETTEFSVKSVNTAKNVTSGHLRGVIRSTYLPIKSVTAEVLDANGDVVVSQTIKNPPQDPTVFQFNNAKADEGFTTLEAGSYQYTITVNTTYGSAKVHQIDFTVE